MSRTTVSRARKFFVSYAGEDLKWARWIVWELENAKAHFRCIAQFKDFAPGMNFMQKMRQAAEADCTLALFSPSYFRSRYCQQELDAALTGDEGRLLAVRVKACDPGAFLQNRIYIDFVSKPIEEARNALLSGVEAYLTLTRKRTGKPVFLERPVFPGFLEEETPHRTQAKPPEVEGPLKVLFLAPRVGGLSPRAQLQAMKGSVAKARFPHLIKFKGVFQVHANTLFRELNSEAPHVFHFSGKQNGGDILMRTENGDLTTVSDMALAGMFRSLDKGLQLVIIDTCYSLRCATTIAKAVPCTMGVEGGILEDEANSFYSIFYQAVASGRSLKDAAAQAGSVLQFTKVPKSHIPQLCYGSGVDPAKIFLVHPEDRAARRRKHHS
ncbi:MAG TPA: toll/interleukin-1 receptor domain-containing protein [Thermoanaerobaculia bacterium]|nr:toll/interleukin-1 receptor domain-containing protein [Thermoanaerobaculia bacterium]